MNPDSFSVKLKQDSPIPLDFDISCNNGEIFVIAGPSGSGKTTVLRSIAGLYKPLSGRIICNGNIWYDTDLNVNVPVQRRAAGFVFQNYALFPHLTVRENIALAIDQTDKKLRSTRVDELLEIVHLSDLDTRMPYQLSGGQQQRVAVARGLARNPQILLLDEPFSSVDQQTRRSLVRELVQLRDRLNIPIVHVTHDLNEARRIADKLCIIDNGQSLQTDLPEKVMTRPVSKKAANLTGHDNVFKGALTAHDKSQNKSRFSWHALILEAPYSPEYQPNEVIDWFIPSTQVVPVNSDNDGENISRGKILEVIQLGEGCILSIELTGVPDIIQMSYPTHQTREQGLVSGTELAVSLRASGIHLMKQT